jgi:hypothetical protein
MPAAPGPKSFLMSEVKAKMGRYASTNFFHVFFTTPDKVKSNVNQYGGTRYNNFIDIACIDATLPGSTFATHEATNDYTGITERHVYRRQFDGKIDFTFAIDREYTLIKYFEAWMGYIGGEASDGYKNYEANSAYRVPFLNEYVCDLTLVKYEKDATIVEKGYSPTRLEYHFVNAFPISISSMPISQGPTDLLTMTVTMDYQKYWITDINGKSGKGATGSGGPQGAKQVPNSAYNDSSNYQLNTDKVPDYQSPELQGGIDRNQYGNNYGGSVPGPNPYESPELKGGIDRNAYGGNKPVQPNNDQPQVSKEPPRVNSDTSFQPNAITDEDRALVEKERRIKKEGLDFY